MLTLGLLFLPLIAALFLLLIKNKAATVALLFSVVELAISLIALFSFYQNGVAGYETNVSWIASLGIHFHVNLDGISILLVFLTSLLVPLIILTASKKNYNAQFYALMALMQFGLVGVFTSLDGFLFYVFWEIALIPAYMICLFWGGSNRVFITFRFFIYTLAGSLLMLAALILLYLHTPYPHSFDLSALQQVHLDERLQGWVFWAFFIAFAIKIPIFPFHTWQPDTYQDAPAQGTMLLSGIMLKMGTFGMLRWLLPLAPLGVMEWGKTAMVLASIGIIYASLIAWMQKDMKRLIAYSSIAHVGLIAAGILSLSFQGIQGSIIQMISHGIVAVGLFYVCDIILENTGSSSLDTLGGVRTKAPWLSGLFLIVVLGGIGLPLTSGFIGEFFLLNGLFQYNMIIAAVAGVSVILGAVYMLNAYRLSMLGELKSTTSNMMDLDATQKITLTLIAGLVILLGVFPNLILNISQPAVTKLLEQIK